MQERSLKHAVDEVRRHRLVEWLAISFIILLSSLVRLRLLNLPLERDEGEYAYMAQQLLHGVPPYISAYSMKLPGIYAAYALSMAIFGQNIAGIHLGLILVNTITILLMFILGRHLLGAFGGAVASGAFALLALGKPVLGLTANAEHFVLLPLVAGLILLLRALERKTNLLLLLSGVLFGCAYLIKQHGVFFFPVGVLAIIGDSLSGREQKRALLTRVLQFTAAAAMPAAVTCLIYLGLGEFQKFWFWTIVFPRSYVTSTSLSSGASRFVDAFQKLIAWAPLLWLLSGLGLVALFLERRINLRKFVITLLAFSFVAVAPGLFFRGHYFLLCLPVVSLLAACGADYSRRVLGRLAWLCGSELAVSAVILVVVFFFAVFPNRYLLFEMRPDDVSRELYLPDTFSFAACVRVADYLKQHSQQNTSVAVVGSEPQIYFYLDRSAATHFVYLYYLTEQHRFTDQFRSEFITEMHTAPPQYIVYSPSWTSELVSQEALNKLKDWYTPFMELNYRLIGAASILSAERVVYRWDKDAEDVPPSARLRILVYERKPRP